MGLGKENILALRSAFSGVCHSSSSTLATSRGHSCTDVCGVEVLFEDCEVFSSFRLAFYPTKHLEKIERHRIHAIDCF